MFLNLKGKGLGFSSVGTSRLFGKNLSKRFGKKVVLKSVDIEVTSGEIVGLLGPNGAGKTTLFYLIVGFLTPTEGKVFLDDRELTGLPMYMRSRLGVTYLPQEPSVFKDLTVFENLKLVEEVVKGWGGNPMEIEDVMELFHLSHLSESKAGNLSGGERRRLEIARSFMMKPKFILLDEPFAGIDPILVEEIKKLIISLKNWGIGVIISDHNVRETLKICDRAYALSEGVILKSGTPFELMGDELVREKYLGGGFSL